MKFTFTLLHPQRLVTVTDSIGRLHCFDVVRRWSGQDGMVPSSDEGSTEVDANEVAMVFPEEGAHDAWDRAEQSCRMGARFSTRAGRVALGLEAMDYRGVLNCLTADDVAALLPAAHTHGSAYPELYSLPPVRSADTLFHEVEMHLAGRSPLGPPH